MKKALRIASISIGVAYIVALIATLVWIAQPKKAPPLAKEYQPPPQVARLVGGVRVGAIYGKEARETCSPSGVPEGVHCWSEEVTGDDIGWVISCAVLCRVNHVSK